ncbi:hypothetical protein A3D91_01950 [candidate division WWE3 bacterium RIFCSPHIGHO2_02_FULL_38_14]|uniref:SHS2 domain-containing protein n=1 Tax=candidate division WWE3 bacterium RIFCSPHIGHO2_02_FULL_38_14 TaxID=1802620 RepID=A0A1F4V6M8_UNCKA|nr:MAG: hypothetical protein A3D91_01950 [candidate division WWE3 bacterium RIFCSPHIGHO2_02_FULL_38_14]
MPIIGLDLGKNNFRAVELENNKGKITLLRFGIYENPKINIEGDNKEDLANYANAVKEFFSETGFTTQNVVVALPEHQVFMRVIKMPMMSDKDLDNSIRFEAEQYIPMPLKEVNLSHQKIDPDLDDKNKINVLIVAAKKSILEKYVEILKMAHLMPKGMEPEALSVGRVLGDSEERPSASIIIDIGVSSSLIIITYRGFVRFTRSIPFGGDVLTRSIQQALSLDYNQAEEYKKAYGLDPNHAEGKIFNILKPIFDNVVMEVKRSKIFFTTHNPNVNINRVILCGGTALMPGILFYMATNLDSEVELANPWRNILISSKYEAKKDYLYEHGPIFSTSVGLAMKEV